VKVSAIRIRELPELDDDWAQSLSEEVESLEQLRAKIRSDMEQQATTEADNKMRGALLRHLSTLTSSNCLNVCRTSDRASS